jgi:hypothetical protein
MKNLINFMLNYRLLGYEEWKGRDT